MSAEEGEQHETAAIIASDLCRDFGSTQVLAGVSLRVRRGEFAAIVGPSGSGKSTLLNIVGLLDRPTSGECSLLGRATAQMTESDRDRLRAEQLGFVFQDSHVLPLRSASENLVLALRVSGVPRGERTEAIEDALAQVGLAHRRNTAAGLLSGGERQRLAVARSMVKRPAVVLADEPTGNLDPDNAEQVVGLLREAATSGAAVVMITHSADLAERADRTLRLSGGRLASRG